jgi:hypothetical protein
MTDFGLVGKALDLLRRKLAVQDEKKLRARFVEIVRGLGPNICYSPKFGSPEYWEAEEMAGKGWFTRVPMGAYRPTSVRSDAFL